MATLKNAATARQNSREQDHADVESEPCFISFGTSSRPAAVMIGVAIRNEKRAASSWRSPIQSPATIVDPDREMPGISAADWLTPTMIACPKAKIAGDPVSRLPPLAFSDKQNHAVDRQERRGDERRAKELLQIILQRQADESGRNRRHDHEQEELLVARAVLQPVPCTSERQEMSNQSRQKKRSSARAVPRCSTTRNGRNELEP